MNKHFIEEEIDISDKHMKRWLLTEDLPVRTAMRYHFILFQIIKINMLERRWVIGSLIYYWWACESVKPLWKIVWHYLLKFTPDGPAISPQA